MKTKTLITTLSIAALALAGCAGTDTQSAGKQLQPIFPDFQDAGAPMDDDYHPADLDDSGLTDEQIERRDAMLGDSETVGHGTFEIYPMTGAEIEFDLPTSDDHERLDGIVQFMKDTNATDTVQFIVADIDNREGLESTRVSTVSVYDEDGNKYEFEPVEDFIDSIEPYTDWADDLVDAYYNYDGTEIDEDIFYDLSERGADLYNENIESVDVAERGTNVLAYVGDDLPDEFTRVSASVSGYDEDAYLTG